MKQVELTNIAADRVAVLRDDSYYVAEIDELLSIIYGLNSMLNSAKDDESLAGYSDEIHKAIDTCLQYYDLMRNLSYNTEYMKDGKVIVTQAEWNE